MKAFSIIMLVLAISLHGEVRAQSAFSVSLKVLPPLDKEKVGIHYDDGGNHYQEAKPVFTENETLIARPFYSKYATLFISYQGVSKMIWVSEKPARVTMSGAKSPTTPFQLTGLDQAIDVDSLAAKEQIEAYISTEQNSLNDFRARNREWFKSDSLIRMHEEKTAHLYAKKVEFVRSHGSDYYAAWLFRRELAFAPVPVDSLLAAFGAAFSDSLKASFEGKEILLELNGRNLKKGVEAVDFTATDITGLPISLTGYRGRYLLLTFWASWCGPCIEEFPTIKTIRQRYAPEKLEMVFVTLDSDSTKFIEAVRKHGLPGIHVYNDVELLKRYGVTSIPKVYLIGPTGTLLYSRDEQRDINLDYLTKLIGEEMVGTK